MDGFVTPRSRFLGFLRSLSAAALAASILPSGCALIDRMSGMSEARDIRKIGLPAQAIILEVWDTGITVSDDPVIGLRLSVRLEGREPYEAVVWKSLVSRVHLPQFQPGRRVPVKVDPADSSRVALDVYEYK